MSDHGSRDHATWSASATARNWNCPGALTLAAKVEKLDRESEAAAWGTACHQISEKCLRSGFDAAHYLGTKEKTKEHEIEVDDEMVETAQTYIDYVRNEIAPPGQGHPKGFLKIEQKFSLASLNPPFDAGGTADAVIYLQEQQSLHVIDLKGGRGVVVEAKGNPQLRTYALGAILANPDVRVKSVKVTIVQPRAGHKDGRIRSEIFHVADLIEWTADLLTVMSAAKGAMVEAQKHGADAQWAKAYLKAGDHCKFCPAAGICPALEQKALDAAGVWFDEFDAPRLANTPESLDPAHLAMVLNAADMIEDWLNACRSLAQRLAESGVEIPDYILVDKIGRRKWAADDDKVVADLLNVVKLTREQVFEAKLRSPAQIEKVLGSKRKGEIANMFHAPVTGTNLVRADKTSRPPATPAVHKHFSPV